jgi:hypothetical protein
MANQPVSGGAGRNPVEGRADHGLSDRSAASRPVPDRAMHDHAHGHGHAAHVSDKGAAFAGLVVGAALLGVILFSVVKITNSHYANEKPAAGAAAHK